MYIPSRSDMVKKRTKHTTMPDRMNIMYAGRTIQARSMNQALKRRPQAAAAKGGSSRSWLRGSPTKPKLVMTVGRYHVNA